MAKLWIRKTCPLLAGALLALTMPSGFRPLGTVVFVALLPALLVRGTGRSFLWGWAFGIAFFAVDLRWLLTLWRFTPMVLPGYLILVLFYGALIAVWKACVARAEHRFGSTTAFLLVSPFLWTLMEWIRAQGPMGFGFSTLYSSLYRTPVLIQSASVFGPWFVSALILLAAGGAYYYKTTLSGGPAKVTIPEKRVPSEKRVLDKLLKKETGVIPEKTSPAAQKPAAPEGKAPTEKKMPPETQKERLPAAEKVLRETDISDPKDTAAVKPPQKKDLPQKEQRVVRQKPKPAFRYPYIIHAGSFRNRETAEGEVQKLREQGFDALVEKAELGEKGIWYRVIIDGFSTRQEAEEKEEELHNKVKGMLSRIVQRKSS